MNKYLYIYNYSPHEKQLCALEFQSIFYEVMASKYYLTDQFFDYTRSPYIKGRLDIIDCSDDFQEIIHHINERQMIYYDFKVIYIKNEITHCDYQESLQKCREIAHPIDGSVNMQDPKVIFAITKIENMWYFGIWNQEMKWNDHADKPYSYSHSLSLRDARAIVNIAVANHTELKVVDPCCGIGTVVLEALSMGIDIRGYDINRYVSYQARLNLEHFGYDPTIIQRQDMREIKTVYDIAVMDIPYGVYSPFSYQQQLELLEGAKSLARKLVLVSHIQMNDELSHIGYHIENQCIISKGNFKRFITVCFNKEIF